MSDNTFKTIFIGSVLLIIVIMILSVYKPNFNLVYIKSYIYKGTFLIILLLLYFAFKQYSITRTLLNGGVKTTAKVVALKELGNNRRVRTSDMSDFQDIEYEYPVFEYIDNLGKTITYESPIASNLFSYKIGDSVTVLYLENNSSEMKVFSFWGLYLWPIILLSFAFLFTIISAWIYYS